MVGYWNDLASYTVMDMDMDMDMDRSMMDEESSLEWFNRSSTSAVANLTLCVSL